jgi:hypothetical protein
VRIKVGWRSLQFRSLTGAVSILPSKAELEEPTPTFSKVLNESTEPYEPNWPNDNAGTCTDSERMLAVSKRRDRPLSIDLGRGIDIEKLCAPEVRLSRGRSTSTPRKISQADIQEWEMIVSALRCGTLCDEMSTLMIYQDHEYAQHARSVFDRTYPDLQRHDSGLRD